VWGTGIPANSYVGAITPGVSFVLRNATGGAVNTTGTVSGINLSAVGINLQCFTASITGGCSIMTSLGVDNGAYTICIGNVATAGQHYIINHKLIAASTTWRWNTPITGNTAAASWVGLINDSNTTHTTVATNQFQATTATALATPRNINGVAFDGTADVTVVKASTVGPYFITPGYKSASYYWANSVATTSTSGALGNSTVRVTPWVVTASVTLTRVFAAYTVAGQSGSVFRIGIWNDDGTGQPGTLLLDAGTIATDGTPGSVEATVSQAITPGLYWIGGAVQNAGTTQPTIVTVAPAAIPTMIPAGTSLPTNTGAAIGYTQSGVSGAFGTFTPSVGTIAPRIGFKVS
jgi:hypothetical protein